MTAVKERQSNMELLRILSMAAVIIVHLDGASVGLPTPGGFSAASAADWWRIIVESVVIVGVNCFTLISGYFGIKARIGGFVRFTLMCMFYSVGLYMLSAFAPRVSWSWTAWIESWMVFTHTDLWYVPAYLLLYLLSPMLNAAVENLPLKKFGLWLGLFIAFNVWAGWLWGANFNPTGYTPVQLIMMYLIGRYIKMWLTERHPAPRRLRVGSATVYAAMTAATGVIALWMEPVKVYAYNSPWVIASSVALFIMFTTFSFTSRSVNRLARGAFAAYLIHKNPAIWGGAMRPLAVEIWQYGSLILYSVFTLIFTAAIYLGATAIDAVREWLFGKCEALFDNKVKVKA